MPLCKNKSSFSSRGVSPVEGRSCISPRRRQLSGRCLWRSRVPSVALKQNKYQNEKQKTQHPCNTVTKCSKSKVQYLVWARRRWDWGIKYWWESYQPVGQERCPEQTSAWAKSWQCNHPAVSRKSQCVKNPPKKFSWLWTEISSNGVLTRSVAPASMNRARLRWKCCWMIRWPRKGANTIRHTHRKLGIVHGFSCCGATHNRHVFVFTKSMQGSNKCDSTAAAAAAL